MWSTVIGPGASVTVGGLLPIETFWLAGVTRPSPSFTLTVKVHSPAMRVPSVSTWTVGVRVNGSGSKRARIAEASTPGGGWKLHAYASASWLSVSVARTSSGMSVAPLARSGVQTRGAPDLGGVHARRRLEAPRVRERVLALRVGRAHVERDVGGAAREERRADEGRARAAVPHAERAADGLDGGRVRRARDRDGRELRRALQPEVVLHLEL